MLKAATFTTSAIAFAATLLLAAAPASANDGKMNQKIRDDIRAESSTRLPIPADYSARSAEWSGYEGHATRTRTRSDADVNGD